MSSDPIYSVLQKLKQFDVCVKNKNKCTPKYALKLVSDQLKLGKPIYRPMYDTQQFDHNKMEIFQFEVCFETESSKHLRGGFEYAVALNFAFFENAIVYY